MGIRRKDITGKIYGKLIVLAHVGKNKHKSNIWMCRCECGEITEASTGTLNSGHKRSCGCLARDMNEAKKRQGAREIKTAADYSLVKYGLSRQPIYEVWRSMVRRCHEENHHAYSGYGARGIKVCKRWHDFRNFFDDMGFGNGLQLERIDNNKGYSLSNCKWATRKEQTRNTRSNRLIEIKGKTKCLVEWAEIYKVNANTAYTRSSRGWKGESILTGVR